MMGHVDINTIFLLAVAALNAFTAYWSHRAKKSIDMASKNIEVIEKATNSMKDALVASTAKASLAEGTAIGRKQVRDELNVTQSGSKP